MPADSRLQRFVNPWRLAPSELTREGVYNAFQLFLHNLTWIMTGLEKKGTRARSCPRLLLPGSELVPVLQHGQRPGGFDGARLVGADLLGLPTYGPCFGRCPVPWCNTRNKAKPPAATSEGTWKPAIGAGPLASTLRFAICAVPSFCQDVAMPHPRALSTGTAAITAEKGHRATWKQEASWA